ncbi:MAG: DUF1062 domain-containing protein [Streptomycetaceae bacterium]|nr:DUF1062 domain-containing protein [Streptomycetaceae bacterium]
MSQTWAVVPTCLPLVRRRCHVCAADRFTPSGKFRVNANHKLLDAWLLLLCTGCGDTVKATLFERANVRSIPPALLDRLHDNDSSLVAELLQDPLVQHRNRITLDWDDAWRLDTGVPLEVDTDEAIDVDVRFAARIPVRPARLIAEGFGLSRGEVGRLVAEGRIVSAYRLDGKLSHDFTFTLKH